MGHGRLDLYGATDWCTVVLRDRGWWWGLGVGVPSPGPRVRTLDRLSLNRCRSSPKRSGRVGLQQTDGDGDSKSLYFFSLSLHPRDHPRPWEDKRVPVPSSRFYRRPKLLLYGRVSSKDCLHRVYKDSLNKNDYLLPTRLLGVFVKTSLSTSDKTETRTQNEHQKKMPSLIYILFRVFC